MSTTTPEGAARAVASFPDDVRKGLEEAQRELLLTLEKEARGRAATHASQLLPTRSIQVESSEPPALVFASGAQVTPTARASDLFWGTEFGGGGRASTMQFPPFKPDGYWLTPAIKKLEANLSEPAREAVLDAWRKVLLRAH